MTRREQILKSKLISRIKKVNGCWEWQGSRSKKGYGYIVVEGKTRTTHRVSWEIFSGKKLKSSSEFVCHHCDNPSCINPKHLFVGNSKKNIDDMVQKRRHKKLLKNVCIKGHVFDSEKINGNNGKPYRSCSICRLEYSKQYYNKNKHKWGAHNVKPKQSSPLDELLGEPQKEET